MLYYDVFPKPQDIINFFRNGKKYVQRTSVVAQTLDLPEKKVSICTTCMNRLPDLKRTLPKNLEDNRDYSNLEFVLLDYNSDDGVANWVRRNLMQHVESGRLAFYSTRCSKYFKPNHSRNLSFRLASGEIVANVDTDNFTHLGYAARINQCFSVADEKVLVVPENFLRPKASTLLLKGRFALYKNDIEWLRGFDEDLDDGFSHDDVNFVLRAMLAGFRIVRFESNFTEGRIQTETSDKVKHVKNPDYRRMLDTNARITREKLVKGKVTVNRDREWGSAQVIKNFELVIDL